MEWQPIESAPKDYSDDITPESLDELGFEKREWQDEGETFHEWIKHKGRMRVEVSAEFKAELSIEERFYSIPNCKTLTDLKHLIRILGV